MFKRFQLCLMAMTVYAGSLLANSHPNPGQWQLSADYVLLRPTLGDEFVFSSNEGSSLDGSGRRNHFDYSSGFRIDAGYAFCDCGREVRLTYTYLDGRRSRRCHGDHLYTTETDLDEHFSDFKGSSHSRHGLNYQDFDIVYAQQIYNCCGLDFYVRIGLEAAYIRFHPHHFHHSEPISATIENAKGEKEVVVAEEGRSGRRSKHHRTWGVGPQIGFAFDWDLWSCYSSCMPGNLSLNVVTSGGLLASQHNRHHHSHSGEIEDNNEAKFGSELSSCRNHDQEWRVVPAFHTKIGLGYQTSCSCGDVGLEVGYEFNSYLSAIHQRHHTGHHHRASGIHHFEDFHVHGLYVSANVRF